MTSIGSDAFYGCCGLTSIVIGNSVTSIGSNAFHGCSGLTSIAIGNSVSSIGAYAFGGCRSLTSLTIGNSGTSIGNYAFFGCNGIKRIKVFAETTPSCGYDVFDNEIYSVAKVTVPNGTLNAYKSANIWNKFADMVSISEEFSVTINGLNYLLMPSTETTTVTCGKQNSLSDY